ncbi:hypothetical protein LP420_23315 [Massilia sp. B-10]|nr:hypothetical protein LP420_23315 [Massilia sp. B-10]UUZ57260.1 hypothetical protein LP419_22760 [Massilia sp. H-1]
MPGASIAACLYIMHGLSNTTYIVFSIVMALALLTYFGYSMRNSALNRAA